MKYQFVCYCGCGQKSEFLGKDYIRLVGRRWCVEGHEKNHKIIKKFLNGYIIRLEEF